MIQGLSELIKVYNNLFISFCCFLYGFNRNWLSFIIFMAHLIYSFFGFKKKFEFYFMLNIKKIIKKYYKK